jgi:diaminopimelate decarboxylase
VKNIVSNEGVEFLKIVVEPGRHIIADSSLLLSKINYVKRIEIKKWLLVDAGMTTL